MKLKAELYKEEQNNIFNKIIDILELEKNNYSITLYELDNNEEIQNKILKMIPEIKKYYKIYGVKSLIYPNEVKRVYLSIIKFIMKSEYKVITTDFRIKNENIIIRTKKYYFIKK